MYKITNHPFVIRIIPGTTIDELQKAPSVINLHKFKVRKLDHLLALANTDLEYTPLQFIYIIFKFRVYF